MRFPTSYSNRTDKEPTCPGNPNRLEKVLETDIYGQPVLKTTGSYNQDDVIQSQGAGCDMSIIAAAVHNGEIRTGWTDEETADLATLPTDIRQCMEVVNSVDYEEMAKADNPEPPVTPPETPPETSPEPKGEDK